MIQLELMRNPLPNESVIVKISKDTYTFDEMSNVFKMIEQAFPNNNVLLIPDSIESLESRFYNGKYNSDTNYT